jgi:hypothetical protein
MFGRALNTMFGSQCFSTCLVLAMTHLFKNPDSSLSSGSRRKTAHGAFSGMTLCVLHAHFFFPHRFGSRMQSSAFATQNVRRHSVVATFSMEQKCRGGDVVLK